MAIASFMFFAYLSFALCVIRLTQSPTDDPSFFLCETNIDGGELCNKTGMAVYIAGGENPTRPSTFYPISHTQWTFEESTSLKYLGITGWDDINASGKFSGVFTAPSSGSYTFKMIASHTIGNSACKFRTDVSPVVIEVDLTYSRTGSGKSMTCTTQYNKKCTDYTLYTDYYTCTRVYTLVKGQAYPIFAGARYNINTTHSDLLWLKLTYTVGKTTARIGKEAVLGLKGYTKTPTASASPSRSPLPTSTPTASALPTSTPTASASADPDSSDAEFSDVESGDDDFSEVESSDYDEDITPSASASTPSASISASASSSDDGSYITIVGASKTNGVVVGGACAGVIVLIAVVVVALWIILRNKKRADAAKSGRSKSGAGSSKGRRSNRTSGSSRRKSSGSSRRRSSGASSSRKSGGSSRRRSSGASSSRRSGSSASGRNSSASASHKTSGTSSRRSGSASHRRSSGASHSRKSGASSRVSSSAASVSGASNK